MIRSWERRQEEKMAIEKHAFKIIYFQIIYVMLSGLLIDLGLPTSIRYLTDVVNLLLVVCVLLQKDKKAIAKNKVPIAVMAAWYLFMVASTCFRDFSVLRIAWASRNWARFFVFFIACVLFLHKKEIERLYKWFFGIYVFDCFLIGFEFAVLGLKQDNLGGIFGSMMGGNGQTNIFLCIMLIVGLCGYFEKKLNKNMTFFVLLSSMVIAALEELKVYFYEYILMAVLICMIYGLKRKSNRQQQMKVIAVAIIGWLIGAVILAILFPTHFKVIVGMVDYWTYEAKASTVYKISRIKFIPQINELFFKDSPILNLIGYGFGNCEYSKFDFLTSPFYREHGEMNYLYFSQQALFLEGGLIGLGLFVAIFVVMTVQHLKKLIVSKTINQYVVLGFVFGLITMSNIFYNNAIRTEISYLSYFWLAVAYIMADEGRYNVLYGPPA